MDVYGKDPVFDQNLVLNKQKNHLAALWHSVIVVKKTFIHVNPNLFKSLAYLFLDNGYIIHSVTCPKSSSKNLILQNQA